MRCKCFLGRTAFENTAYDIPSSFKHTQNSGTSLDTPSLIVRNTFVGVLAFLLSANVCFIKFNCGIQLMVILSKETISYAMKHEPCSWLLHSHVFAELNRRYAVGTVYQTPNGVDHRTTFSCIVWRYYLLVRVVIGIIPFFNRIRPLSKNKLI